MTFTEPGSLVVLTFRLANIFGTPYYKNFVKSIGLKGNEKVLEYGSGAGNVSRHIARSLLKGDGHLTCVDISRVWLGVIKKALKKFPNVDYKIGDISGLDLKDGHYDIAVIHFVLHEIDEGDRQDKVNVIVKKLNMGGRIVIKEPINEGHGMPAEDIVKIMKNAGLQEKGSWFGKSFLTGHTYHGVFERSA
ncbi:hypothetical protein CUJ83_08765 [Methanocella sp. CWC-04]|uniref:Methyltransferase domain-containing protein n=1 Tax=Methanooceanicella nereidis TaxID=2052831 RepID=A0AAP2RD19_9EURY|nr:class I SAM-dependent methyltransferase [Methanocella sp. CWC-04]MCD1295088.1 hypothetical protein [Methanocella sp. CWC-04]